MANRWLLRPVDRLRKDLSAAELATFAVEIQRLAQIPYLERGFVGTPAQTPQRGVTDNTVDYATSLDFKTLEDHQFYQAKCEIHSRFVATCRTYWRRVVVHDISPVT